MNSLDFSLSTCTTCQFAAHRRLYRRGLLRQHTRYASSLKPPLLGQISTLRPPTLINQRAALSRNRSTHTISIPTWLSSPQLPPSILFRLPHPYANEANVMPNPMTTSTTSFRRTSSFPSHPMSRSILPLGKTSI